MGGPYSEKPWPKSLKWEGSIFQNGWQFFTIGKDPKPENKLFTFSSFSQIVFTLVKHFQKQRVRVTMTVRKSVQRYEPTRLQDLLPFSLGKKRIFGYQLLLLNQNTATIYEKRLPPNWDRQFEPSLKLMSISIEDRFSTIAGLSIYMDYLFILFICLLLNLRFTAHLKKRRTDATGFNSLGQFNEMQLVNAI